MKTKIMILASALFITFSAFGQTTKDVPADIKAAFTKKFSNATGIKWSKENDKEWEAEFKLDGMEYSANFDIAGNWLETEYEITSKDIPAVIKTSLDKESVGYKIEESEISETKDGKTYEFVIEKGKVKMELAIDANGKVLKKEQLKEEDEEDEKE